MIVVCDSESEHLVSRDDAGSERRSGASTGEARTSMLAPRIPTSARAARYCCSRSVLWEGGWRITFPRSTRCWSREAGGVAEATRRRSRRRGAHGSQNRREPGERAPRQRSIVLELQLVADVASRACPMPESSTLLTSRDGGESQGSRTLPLRRLVPNLGAWAALLVRIRGRRCVVDVLP